MAERVPAVIWQDRWAAAHQEGQVAIRNNKGMTIIELLLISSFLIAAMFPLISTVVTMNDHSAYIGGRIDSKIEAAQLLLQMSNLGRVANWCVNPNQVELVCGVQFDPAGAEEQISFVYRPTDQTLTYTRNGRLFWTAEAVQSFVVCNGREIQRAECRDGNASWSGSTVDHVEPSNLRHFFRARMTIETTYRKREEVIRSGEIFSVQAGFYNRNTASDAPRYVWRPMGGS